MASSTNREKKPIWILFGPALLLSVIGLLLFKSDSIIWLCGLCISALLATWISYLTFQEIAAHNQEFQCLSARKDKESNDLRATLDETHVLYREKVSKLENSLCDLEEKQSAEHSEVNHYKSRARAFEASLEEALTELRNLSQLHYLQQEEKVPKNLVKEHAQLREQFEEKSLVLDQTRRRLFEVEGFLLALKKERGLELLSQNEEQEILIKEIGQLITENERLEKEVIALESLVSLKATAPKKTQKKLQDMLEFQFETSTSSKE